MTSKTFSIGKHILGYGRPVFIIAEAGVNHNGKLDLALKLVDAAADAGADAVKFQTFRAEDVVTAQGEMAAYQKKNIGKTESQLAMLKKLELPEKFYGPIMRRCKARKILFMSTPHGGKPSVDVLIKLNVAALKLGSGELTNAPLIQYAASFKKPMILSSGMGTFAEVQKAIAWAKKGGARDLVMLHCTTNYPCTDAEVNLRAMQMMKEKLDVLVGYSDHSTDIQIPVMAATLGAAVIEKHFTVSRKLHGPDHAASLEPRELAEMVRAVRRASVILGSPVKKPNPSEKAVMHVARKSVVAVRAIAKGDVFTQDNLGVKRPGTGLAPETYFKMLGKRARRNIPADALIKRHDF